MESTTPGNGTMVKRKSVEDLTRVVPISVTGCTFGVFPSKKSFIPCPNRKKILSKQIPKRTHGSRNTTTRSKAKYVGKVKCLTLQPAHTSGRKSKVMLGLKDSKGDGGCEYESIAVSTSQKRIKSGRKGRATLKNRQNSNSPKNSCLLLEGVGTKELVPEIDFKGTVKTEEQEELKCNSVEKEKDSKENKNVEEMKVENSEALYEFSGQNEENSKAFMESIGCWINDLFSVPNKRNSSSNGDKEAPNKELPSEEDAEFLKSISTIKEQFRKKLKNETIVHISAPETPFELNFDKVLVNPKKQKKRPKTNPQESNSSDWLDQFNQDLAFPNEPEPRQNNSNTTALVIRTGKSIKPVKQKNALDLLLVNEKKKPKVNQQSRRDIAEQEDYSFPKAGELSKKLLLNVNDQEKFAQFYKNTHLGAQDYGQRKGKAYQSNTRCYTTKAKGRGKFSTGTFTSTKRGTYYSSGSATHQKGFGEGLSKTHRKNSYRNSSRKTISELSRDAITFTRGGGSAQIQESKIDLKTSSHELVKYLVKRVKSGRPQLVKKKGKTKVPQILGVPKSRFRQSATNSLVTTALAKMEIGGQTSTKLVPWMYADNKVFPPKDHLLAKQSDTGMRFDIARAMKENKLTKYSYLLENEKPFEDEYLPAKGGHKNKIFAGAFKPSYAEVMKREMYKNEKFIRKQEVNRMLSNLDKKSVFQAFKMQTKKETPTEETTSETGELQNARFQKQHELFKRNNKTSQTVEVECVAEEKDEAKAKEAEHCADGASPATELAVIDPNASFPENFQEKKRATEQTDETVESEFMILPSRNPDHNVRDVETFCKEKPLFVKFEKKGQEKPTFWKEKGSKVKSLAKVTGEAPNSESKSLMTPLGELCSAEQNHKEHVRSYNVHIPPKELGPGKQTEALMLNRRYSMSAPNSSTPSPGSVLSNDGHQFLYFLESGKDKPCDKEKELRPKEDKTNSDNDGKSKTPKRESHCGFDAEEQKPGPICEDK